MNAKPTTAQINTLNTAPAPEAGRSARRANALRAVQVARKLSTSQTVALAKLANRDGIVDAGGVIPVNTAVAMQARGLMSYQFHLAGRAVYLLTGFGYEVAGINRAALVERCHAEALAEADVRYPRRVNAEMRHMFELDRHDATLAEVGPEACPLHGRSHRTCAAYPNPCPPESASPRGYTAEQYQAARDAAAFVRRPFRS